MKPTSSFATLLQRFFTQRLMHQQQASRTRSAPIATRSGCCFSSL